MLYLRSFLFNLICYGTLAFGCLVTSVVGLFNRKITIVEQGLYSVYSLEFETCGGY